MIYDNILQVVGNTPIIKLNKTAEKNSAEILVKFEALNVGGSIKTRTALNMILDAESKGLLTKGSVIVEVTSGNQGVGIALVGAVKGYKVKIVMPDSVSCERLKLMKQYGAEVILIHDNGNIGECIKKCLQVANEIKNSCNNAFMPRQFENVINVQTHKYCTGQEIIKQINKPIHGFCAGIGTGGTITGIGEILKEYNKDIEIWAVEPENSAILSGGGIGMHLQMGIGDGIIPPILNRDIYNKVCVVTDAQAIQTAKNLAKQEGILCGITGGSNVFSAIQLAKKLGKGKTVITVLPDTAERYFSTPLFDN